MEVVRIIPTLAIQVVVWWWNFSAGGAAAPPIFFACFVTIIITAKVIHKLKKNISNISKTNKANHKSKRVGKLNAFVIPLHAACCIIHANRKFFACLSPNESCPKIRHRIIELRSCTKKALLLFTFIFLTILQLDSFYLSCVEALNYDVITEDRDLAGYSFFKHFFLLFFADTEAVYLVCVASSNSIRSAKVWRSDSTV